MPTHAGPKQVAKENLVFAIDAADKKNSILPLSTTLNMSSWTLGAGSIGAYSRNGDTAENERVLGTDPYGRTSIVWETRPSGNGQADGGWNTSYFSVNTEYTYRYSVWVKRTSSISGGTFYLGMNPNPIRNDNNLSQSNPYFTTPSTSTLTQNQWYLVVSHVFYAGYSEGKRHPDSGWYENGIKISDKSYGNIGSLDSRWATGTTTARHRTYHYYCPNNTTNLQFFDPRMDMCDGTEPSISDLLKLSPSHTTSLIGNRSGRLTNGTIWSRNNQGTFVLDGTNDYIDLGEDITISPTNQGWTAEYIFKTNSAGTLQHFNSAEADDFNANWLAINGSKLAIWNVSPSYWKYGSTIIQSNTWYHAVFICDVGGTNYRYYINGVREGGDHVNNEWTAAYSALKTRYIGQYEYNGSYSRYFNGEIPIVKFYNTALSDLEVKQNYNQYKSRFNLS
jgi:hypothetical protein